VREPTITGHEALRERLSTPAQLDATVQESAMPPYMDAFLANLRVLIGVPFDYLVPDSRLLPDESARFFYLDRSWTDRLVDGAIAVGKIGTREQAHHQAHAPDVQSALDSSERLVRGRQRGLPPPQEPDDAPANVVTGFLLRSAAVAGWPSMEVRAFSSVLPQYPTTQQTEAAKLTTLRLDLLSPSVLFALFDGIPKLVWCEEPHHGVQFGFENPSLARRDSTGHDYGGTPIPVPMRASNPRVVAVQALRDALFEAQTGDSTLVQQTGSGAFAIELLLLPWRQRFQGAGGTGETSGGFVSVYSVANRIVQGETAATLRGML
jgi:hypothetical protein